MKFKVRQFLATVFLLVVVSTRIFAAGDPTATGFNLSAIQGVGKIIQLQGAQINGHSLAYAITSGPSHGAISQLNAGTGVLLYTATSNYTGSDSFTYTVASTDTSNAPSTSSAATVTITVVSNQKTAVNGTLYNIDGSPMVGSVSWILSTQATTHDGIQIPAGGTVSANLVSGSYTVNLYPTDTMSPPAYYQLWFLDAAGTRRQVIGVYNIPTTGTTMNQAAISGAVVTDTNLAKRYTFMSETAGEAILAAVGSTSSAHNMLSATHSDAVVASVVAGDLMYGNGTPKWDRLPKGTDTYVLTMVSGLPAWQAPAATGANAALSNLASVSINTSLLAQTGVDAGSTVKPFRNLYLYGGGTYGTNYFKLDGTPTGTRTLTIPDRTATFGTTAGTLTSGNLAKFDASGNSIDSTIVASNVALLDGTQTFTNPNIFIGQRTKFEYDNLTTAGSPTTNGAHVQDTVVLQNLTAATSGVPTQSSPSLEWLGSKWDSSGSASFSRTIHATLVPAGSGAGGGTFELVWDFTAQDDASDPRKIRFDSTGKITFAGLLVGGSSSTAITDSTGKVNSAALNTVAVSQGGSGATSLTGLLVGNGTSAFSTVTAPSGAVVGTTDSQTLTNNTLTTPTISSFANATHTHTNSAGGGQLIGTSALSDYTTAFVNSLTGTSNEISISSSAGSVTISTPQAIGTASSPQFGALGLGVAATGSGIKQLEAAAPSFAASSDVLYADSTAHRWKMSNNNGTADTVVGAATTDTLTNKSMSEAQVTFTDITTGNASTSNHGFVKKLTGSASDCYLGDGTFGACSGAGSTGANPSASVGLSAVNGSASTFLRSDGAPALSQAIAPTWTGVHIFTPGARSSGVAPFFTINIPTDTGLTASTEAIGISIVAGTQTHATGAIAENRHFVGGSFTDAFVGASTVTRDVGYYFAAPTRGANATFTTGIALMAEALNAVDVPLYIRAAGSQTGDLFRMVDSSNVILSKFRSDGTLQVGGGSSSTAGLSLGGTASTGFYLPQSADIAIILASSNALVSFNANGATELNLASGASLGFGSSANAAAVNSDTVFTRKAAAVFGLGLADAASPVNYKIRGQGSRSGTDSNVAGASITLSAGLGTGTGTVSSLFLSSPITVGSGSGAQTETIGLEVNAGNIKLPGLVSKYNNVTTAGWGVPAIYAAGRSTAQTAAVASVAAYTVGAADGSFEVSANLLVTASTTHSITVTVAYTDEGNTARTLTLSFSQLTGTFLTAITNVQGVAPYEGVPLHIRCKASTSITIATTGTFTSVTYNVEGIIKQTS